MRSTPNLSQEEPKKGEKCQPGQLVLHPQFGIGRIERIVNTSMGDAYEVFFSNDQTLKKILASASPLKPIGKPG
jgi:transcription-repair coupling factor (superfamily II helicase)